MEYIINKGDTFLCIKDFVMNNENKTVEYTKGKTYISEWKHCITDNSKRNYHVMGTMKNFFDYFVKI